ncbi:cellulose binding domain-containing protein [Streptomyces sp. V3I7]|uniref:cellulose binding domain-containing protein n=1 Tax=Streptomyces sp. V3I7 TaxID=3042278 RepID=UPI00277D8B82|nr:cellulose binding domain-containing protein [Streptomyces sp. V3I7]MDQ0993735.1 hypothetical protein [Streptomyces sp. V3I7]
MPDLPTPQNAAEAALFSECWDAVLSYADLCTSGSVAAGELAREAFTLGIREVRAAESSPVRGAGRRPARLPAIPLLLTAVRLTAAGWEAEGLGHKLDPEFRLWLHSDGAARYTGPPLKRPLALRGLKDMQEADAALLWLTEVEALPLTAVARRLSLDPATVTRELDQVRGLFRDRCHRAHRDTPLDARCRSYGSLLDALTRSAATDGTPEDLSRHVATCVQCAEAAACMRLHGGGLPAALAGGVIGWGGLAYLERRRRAADATLNSTQPEASADRGADEAKDGSGRTRVVRNGLLGAAVLLSVLALGVSMMPFGSGGDDTAARDDGRPVADPGPALPTAVPPPPKSPTAPRSSAAPSPSHTTKKPDRPSRTPQTRRPSASSRPDEPSRPATTAPPTCRIVYDVVDEWNDGFQATVAVTTAKAVSDWSLVWTFPDGQKIDRMWDASPHQDGSRVTADARDYNKSLDANGTASFGFIGFKQDKNASPTAFTLNGDRCEVS